METLNWKYDGQQYVLQTIHGTAFIVELLDEGKQKVIGAVDRNRYLPRLELNDGTVREPVGSWRNGFDDFETAEAWLLYHELASLDTPEQLFGTLQYCAQLLFKAAVAASYLQQLKYTALGHKMAFLDPNP